MLNLANYHGIIFVLYFTAFHCARIHIVSLFLSNIQEAILVVNCFSLLNHIN